jgi:hypothetical protein
MIWSMLHDDLVHVVAVSRCLHSVATMEHLWISLLALHFGEFELSALLFESPFRHAVPRARPRDLTVHYLQQNVAPCTAKGGHDALSEAAAPVLRLQFCLLRDMPLPVPLS